MSFNVSIIVFFFISKLSTFTVKDKEKKLIVSYQNHKIVVELWQLLQFTLCLYHNQIYRNLGHFAHATEIQLFPPLYRQKYLA